MNFYAKIGTAPGGHCRRGSAVLRRAAAGRERFGELQLRVTPLRPELLPLLGRNSQQEAARPT